MVTMVNEDVRNQRNILKAFSIIVKTGEDKANYDELVSIVEENPAIRIEGVHVGNVVRDNEINI